MNDQKVTQSEAEQSLASLSRTQAALINDYRPSVAISIAMSVCYGIAILGFALTEHENDWALAIWGGILGFAMSTALYIYSYRLKGINVGIFPRSNSSVMVNVYAGIGFALLTFASRFLRESFALDAAAYVCAIIAASLFFWLNRKYPTGEKTVDGV